MNQTINYLFQDWQVNQDTSFKSRLIMVMFRLNRCLQDSPILLSWILFPYRFFYQLVVEWVLGIELPWDTQLGSKLKLQHGHGLVVNHTTMIGENCTLRNSTTIGNKKLADGTYSLSPRIGNNVDVGANVVIIGAIEVGDDAVIGAGSVVVKDVPAGAIVAGNPARIIRMVKATSFATRDREEHAPELEVVASEMF